MIKPNLTEDMECVGEFYTNNDKKIAGSLKFVNGQIRLHLLNNSILPSPEQIPSNNLLKIPIISGNTDKGEVTVIDTWFRPLDFQSTSHGTALYAIFGASNLFEISNLIIKFDVLEEWALPKEGFNIPKGKFLPDLEKYTFFINGIRCSLIISVNIGNNVLKGKSISHTAYFNLESKIPQDVRKYMEIFQSLKSFLQIMTGRNVKPIETYTKINKRNYPFYLPLDKSDPYGSNISHIINFTPATYDWKKIFEKWFAFHTSNEYMISLFLESMETQIIKDLDFFALASILEGLYKASYPPKKIKCKTIYSEKRYVRRIERILNDVFKDHFTNLDEFISDVEEFRHDNFHLNSREKIDDEKLTHLTIDLHNIIRYIFLHQSGLDVIDLLNNGFPQKLTILK